LIHGRPVMAVGKRQDDVAGTTCTGAGLNWSAATDCPEWIPGMSEIYRFAGLELDTSR
jgi:hypothetical protein